MTAPQENQEQVKTNDKEMNFRALEAKYQRQLEVERAARIEAERKVQEAQASKQVSEEDEDDSEPYVDKKKLSKTLAKFGQQNKQETQSEILRAVKQAREEEKKEAWLENNPDFYETIQTHAEKLLVKAPGISKSILAMPDNFERQKLVYQTIKELGINKAEQREPSVQEKIDANRRNPYYQPSVVGAAPYASQGDYSPSGKKNAYDKMQELKNRLRLG